MPHQFLPRWFSVRRGFTLIELLVVVAIVGLIAALLFPVYARSRDKARQTVCTSNLRQIGLATLQYVQDNDGRMFDALPFADENGETHWSYRLTLQRTIDTSRGRLGAYVTDSRIWNCPSAPDPHTLEGPGPLSNVFPPYGINELLAHQRVLEGSPPFLAEVQVPAETILVADCAPADDVIQGTGHAEPDIYPPSQHNPWVHGRHNGMANVLWFDGHVAARHPVAAYDAQFHGQGPTIADLEAAQLGDILKGPYTGNAQTDDYYYELAKP